MFAQHLLQTSSSSSLLWNKAGNFVIKRWRKNWVSFGSARRKTCPTNLALKYFDQHYNPLLQDNWQSVRLALLSLQKYGALVNRFGDVEKSSKRLQSIGSEDFVQPASKKLKEFYKENLEVNQKIDEGEAQAQSTGDFVFDVEQTSNIDDVVLEEKNLATERTESDIAFKDIFVNDLKFKEDDGYIPEQKRTSWRDEYIVTPGFESKLEYMIGVEHRPNDELEIRVDVSQISLPIEINPLLHCCTHSWGEIQKFPPSKMSSPNNVLQYYLMDASSLLPVVALDIRAGDKVLDLCAAPGGKAMVMLQTADLGCLVMNDRSTPRLRRLEKVLSLFVPSNLWSSGKIQLSQEEGQMLGEMEPAAYNKVLVDVPCTTDRHSLSEEKDNIFAAHRMKERWDLPSLQEQLLCSGIQSVRPGGDVVYSTCTFSPLQNDGVIQGAIQRCSEEYGIEVAVVDLSPMKYCFDAIFKFYDGAQYGQLIVPHIAANFGPMYFARLHRFR